MGVIRFLWTDGIEAKLVTSTLISMGIITVYLLAVHIPDAIRIDSEITEQVKLMDCDVLKEKIYNKDFERWFANEDEIKHEYQWRCQK